MFLQQTNCHSMYGGFDQVWVGLGHGSISSPDSGLGWVGSMKLDPRTTLRGI